MECFYHEGRPAVGSCRSCFRGLCRACGVDLDRALACRGRCEDAARALVSSLEQSLRYQSLSTGMVRTASHIWVGLALVCLFVGVFVSTWGMRQPRYREISLLGLPFLALAGLLLVVLRNLRRARSQASKPTG
jgi:hypothetical protein